MKWLTRQLSNSELLVPAISLDDTAQLEPTDDDEEEEEEEDDDDYDDEDARRSYEARLPKTAKPRRAPAFKKLEKALGQSMAMIHHLRDTIFAMEATMRQLVRPDSSMSTTHTQNRMLSRTGLTGGNGKSWNWKMMDQIAGLLKRIWSIAGLSARP